MILTCLLASAEGGEAGGRGGGDAGGRGGGEAGDTPAGNCIAVKHSVLQ